jgi:hypothetical protein
MAERENNNISQETNLILQTFYTCVLLTELKNNKFIESDYFKNMKFGNSIIKSQIASINVDNQGTLLMVLYAMLVVPKQLLWDNYPDDFGVINQQIEEIAFDTETTYNSDNPDVDFLRHIRNAVAHAKVEFEPNVKVTFKDRNNRGDRFKTSIPLDKIGVLLTGLQSIYIKYVNDINSV